MSENSMLTFMTYMWVSDCYLMSNDCYLMPNE